MVRAMIVRAMARARECVVSDLGFGEFRLIVERKPQHHANGFIEIRSEPQTIERGQRVAADSLGLGNLADVGQRLAQERRCVCPVLGIVWFVLVAAKELLGQAKSHRSTEGILARGARLPCVC
jgi:hypothetical protein